MSTQQGLSNGVKIVMYPQKIIIFCFFGKGPTPTYAKLGKIFFIRT
jgi:hypothetical protein